MYQNYVREIDAALTRAVETRKPHITVITNKYWGNSPLRNLVMCSTFETLPHFDRATLQRLNVDTYYFDVPETLYHKKVMVSRGDKETCYANGSYNLGTKSHGHDDEIELIFCHPNGVPSVAGHDVMEALQQDMRLSVHADPRMEVYRIRLTSEEMRAGGVRGFLRWLGKGLGAHATEMIGNFAV